MIYDVSLALLHTRAGASSTVLLFQLRSCTMINIERKINRDSSNFIITQIRRDAISHNSSITSIDVQKKSAQPSSPALDRKYIIIHSRSNVPTEKEKRSLSPARHAAYCSRCVYVPIGESLIFPLSCTRVCIYIRSRARD